MGDHRQPKTIPAGARTAANTAGEHLDQCCHVWGIAIKHSLGRGDMPVSSQDAVRYFRESGYRFLTIETEHALALKNLPAHHQDPFDRMLVAQAMVEPMRLLTHDATMALYSDTILKI
ncbi:type II toxin-antitoxin system VapC family toxin [Acidithiobacillus montserratensis]|uniref:Type II toxin-antitoxin system VapC family toxin n=1 Tax=Acidithiobacillus montserratensis TaxID=2729135 RepID=A0ACD5HJX3_9PROT|nr:type II toxin-antitoxin system VapC family toxin [Acidithiobacillus montserratensis]